jgi:hypothetical protein
MFFQRISEMLSEAKENQKETQENDCVVAALPRALLCSHNVVGHKDIV